MNLTPKQINELLELIKNLHWVFINEQLGSKFIPNSIMQTLKKFGVKESMVKSFPEYSFQFGMLSMIMEDEKTSGFTFNQFKKYIKTGQWLPLTKEEQYALELIENRLVDNITGLGNKIASDLKNILIENDLKYGQWYKGIVKKKAKEVFSKRQGVRSLVSELGISTGDWARDLGRVSQYILHEAFDNGRAYSMLREHDGKADEVLVYKRVHKGACSICNKLYDEYVSKEKQYKPKVFKLSELMNNGTNIGKKREDWLPVIGATHPWCRCDLMYLGKNKVYDFVEKRFRVERSELSKRFNLRKFIKIKIEY